MSENRLSDDDLRRLSTIVDMTVTRRLDATKSSDVRQREEERAARLMARWLKTVDSQEKIPYLTHVRTGTSRWPVVEGVECPPPNGVLRSSVAIGGVNFVATHQTEFMLSDAGQQWLALSDQHKFGNRISMTATRLALVVDNARRKLVYFSQPRERAPSKDSLGVRRPGSARFWERASTIVSIDRIQQRGIPPTSRGQAIVGPFPLTRWLRIVPESDIEPEAWRLVEGDLNNETLGGILAAVPSLEDTLKPQGKTAIAAPDEPSLMGVIRAKLVAGEKVDVASILEQREAAAAA